MSRFRDILNELSKKYLGRYIKHASGAADHLVSRDKEDYQRPGGGVTLSGSAHRAGKSFGKDANDSHRHFQKSIKRMKGISLATDKLTNTGVNIKASKSKKIIEGWYGGPENHEAAFNENHLSHAKRIIGRAEKDLGKLSDGQRRDLLADRTTHPMSRIHAIVKHIGGLKEDLDGMDPVNRIYAKHEISKGSATWHDSNSLKKRKVSGLGGGDIHARLMAKVANQNSKPKPKLSVVRNEETELSEVSKVFTNGSGYGAHGIKHGGHTYSAWYHADGTMHDAEKTRHNGRIIPNGTPVKKGGPVWKHLQSKSGLYAGLADDHEAGVHEETVSELSKSLVTAVQQAADEKSIGSKKHMVSADLAHKKLFGGAKVPAKKAQLEGKTWKSDDYRGDKIKDTLKKNAKDRQTRRAAKRTIAEDLYPEVRSLNKKKRPSKTRAILDPTGIR